MIQKDSLKNLILVFSFHFRKLSLIFQMLTLSKGACCLDRFQIVQNSNVLAKSSPNFSELCLLKNILMVSLTFLVFAPCLIILFSNGLADLEKLSASVQALAILNISAPIEE